MSDPPLERHPHSGNPVKKCFSSPNLNTLYSELENKQRLDPKNLEKQGFTQYEKDKTTGRYYKKWAPTNGLPTPLTLTKVPRYRYAHTKSTRIALDKPM